MGPEIQNTSATGGYISPSSTRRATLQRFSRSEPRGGASVVTWDMPIGGATTATNHGAPRASADTGCRERNRFAQSAWLDVFRKPPDQFANCCERATVATLRARASTLI